MLFNIDFTGIRNLFDRAMGRYDPVTVIDRAKTQQRTAAAFAAEVASVAALDIEDAVDDELEVIRFTVKQSFERITRLMATGSVHTKAAVALISAQEKIEAALKTVDEAI